MQVTDVVTELLSRAPMSARAVSRELGHAPAWAGLAARSERGPYLATVADVADVAGVDVVLIDRATGERVGVVEPPRKREG